MVTHAWVTLEAVEPKGVSLDANTPLAPNKSTASVKPAGGAEVTTTAKPEALELLREKVWHGRGPRRRCHHHEPHLLHCVLSWPQLSPHVGVAATAIAPCVTVTVIVPCSVGVMVVAPCGFAAIVAVVVPHGAVAAVIVVTSSCPCDHITIVPLGHCDWTEKRWC